MKPDEGSSEELCEVHCPRSVIVDSVEDAFLAIWEEMVEAMNCLDDIKNNIPDELPKDTSVSVYLFQSLIAHDSTMNLDHEMHPNKDVFRSETFPK